MTHEKRLEGNEVVSLWVSRGRSFQAEATASTKPQVEVCSRKSKESSVAGVSRAKRREFEVGELENARGRSRRAYKSRFWICFQ